MTAVAQNGTALRYAGEELRGDRETLEVALRDRDILALKVTLLSGRCCTQVFSRTDRSLRRRVLWECAVLLDLDPVNVVLTGTLIQEL